MSCRFLGGQPFGFKTCGFFRCLPFSFQTRRFRLTGLFHRRVGLSRRFHTLRLLLLALLQLGLDAGLLLLALLPGLVGVFGAGGPAEMWFLAERAGGVENEGGWLELAVKRLGGEAALLHVLR
ncbi:MAG: hypothetical protein IJT83_10935 [Victivallales bacterium]|nr:hypothetical protein [Victivallales bacterium]